MRSYFDMLNLPPTATPQQIQLHYEYLTHLYHPDHFSNPLDIVQAKRKYQALTAAYHALMGSESDLTQRWENMFIPPSVTPALIDWGIVRQGTQLSAQIKIQPGSAAQTIVPTTVGKTNWLVMSHRREIKVENEEPVVLEVVANTQQMRIGKKYSGQIKVTIDTVTLPVLLMVQIAPPFAHSVANDQDFSLAALYINNLTIL